MGELHATGYFGPTIYLANGGENVDGSPEFYWGLEVRRLAHEFHPGEKFVVTEKPKPETDEETAEAANARGKEATVAADLKEFESAIKEGRIKPPDPTKAKQSHADARGVIHAAASVSTTPSTSTSASESATPPALQATAQQLPAEFDSEFADYHKGATAFSNQQWDAARAAWENLLKRPEQDRHYRTVWAAFMLGKLALKTKDFQTATQWFQRTRELAQAGFADSLGLAADSYGWEGRAEWKQDHPERAAPLFLNQLALGDASAIVSLKAVIPDRSPTEGLVNYGPEPEERNAWNDQQKKEQEEKEIAKLKSAARNPLLRRLVTVHILATSAVSPEYDSEDAKATAVNRCGRWLKIIKEASLGRIEDAEYLGWVAYNNGDYKDATHWLELSKGDSGAALWLKAKLQRRAGKLADAANTMAKAWETLRNSLAYKEAERTDEELSIYEASEGEPSWRWDQSASGDLGGLRLARGDFVQALDVLFKGKLWEDTAFVAERVLTTNELKQYVDALPPAEKPKESEDYNAKLRWLLGRRLVRDDRYAEAEHYLSPPYHRVLEKYVKALKDGGNEKLSKTERAHAWFTAAWLARYDGMELMGTEFAPDAFAEGGSFEIPDLANERKSGVYEKISYTKNGDEKKKTVPIPLRPSEKEIRRLKTNKVEPNVRFHYRLIAGALAIKAAALLPDNSEELADVVNQAGLWVKDRDEKIGDRYYQIIDRRCTKTKIGETDRARHWFVDQEGPRSKVEEAAYRTLHKELGLESPEPEPEASPTPESSPTSESSPQ